MNRCEHCHRAVLPGDERVDLFRAGAFVAFHARCFATASGSPAEDIDRIVERESAAVIAAAERLISDPPAA